jgi:hypothetical protein
MDYNKLARLIFNLYLWAERNKAYALDVPEYAVRWEATRTILGLEDYVSNGMCKLKPTMLVCCASCESVHRLPISTTIYFVDSCVTCSTYVDPFKDRYWLHPLPHLLMSLPEQVTEAFLDRLADKYYTQLGAKGIDT